MDFGDLKWRTKHLAFDLNFAGAGTVATAEGDHIGVDHVHTFDPSRVGSSVAICVRLGRSKLFNE